MLCLLLDHGLRVGKAVALTIGSIDLAAGTLTFYREKVDIIKTCLLSPATLRAALAYISNDLIGIEVNTLLLRGSRKNGALFGALGIRSIQSRIGFLCEAVGLKRLSPHDCRHY